MTAAFLIYILKWASVLLLLYSLYGLALRRETFHGFNRGVLLSILGLSMLLPLCRIHTEYATPMAGHVEEVETFIHDMSDYYVVEEAETLPAVEETLSAAMADEVEGITTTDTVFSSWNRINIWLRLIIIVYAVGLAVVWLAYLRSLISLFILIARGRRVHIDGLPKWMRVVQSRVAVTPCSWMCWIILGPDEISDTAVKHEMTHLRFRHSLDLLLAEFTARMLWFVPVGWMLLQDLKDVHEYQVDHRLLSDGVNAEEYQELLINQVTAPNNMANRSYAVANSLVLSSIKKRFTMMYKKPSSRKAALKALYLLPCTLLAMTVFAKPAVMNNIQETLEHEEAVAPLLSANPIVEQVVEKTTAPEAEQMAAEEAKKQEEQAAEDDKRQRFVADSLRADSARQRAKGLSDVLRGVMQTHVNAIVAIARQLGEQGFVPVGDQNDGYVFEHKDGRVITMTKDFSDIKMRRKSDMQAEEARKAKKQSEASSELEDSDLPLAVSRVEMYLQSLTQLQNEGYVISRETETQMTFTHPHKSTRIIAKPSLEEQKQYALAKERQQTSALKANGKAEDEKSVRKARTVVNIGGTPAKHFKKFKAKDLPANKAPKLVREQAANYDYFDHETFSAYEDFQSVDIMRGTKIWNNMNVEIYPTKKCTYVVFYQDYLHHDNDEWVFFLFPSNISIIDTDSGNRYQIRKLHHYPLDTFFLHHNNAKSIHMFIAEFPPLKNDVERIQFEYPDTPARKWWDGGGETSAPLYLSDLIPIR